MQLSTLEKIVELIQSSLLLSQKKDELIDVATRTDGKEQETLLNIFQADPEWIGKLSDNLTKKREAFDSGGKETWRKIIEEEIMELEKLSATETR